MLDAKHFPKWDLARLYKARWHIELDIRAIKTHMGIDAALQDPADGAKGNRRGRFGLQCRLRQLGPGRSVARQDPPPAQFQGGGAP
jgi:hypothetical protein